MDLTQKALQAHYDWHGKIEVVSRAKIRSKEDLSIAYTPGVAAACLAIAEDKDRSFSLTRRSNLVAVITDGTAVLGLGDIGPEAAMPVMEGKCALFKEFAGVDAFPICIDSKDTDTLVETITLISKSFGGINLEDISAPRCFELEQRLKERCDIPVFHDDQHGTAVVVCAALLNALKVTGRQHGSVRIVLNGAGAAGIAITKLILQMGFGDVVMCDKKGIVCEGEPWLNEAQSKMAMVTNRQHIKGTLSDAVKGSDVFIGVSGPNVLTAEMVKTMDVSPIIFAMANPAPEIMPEEAFRGGAAVVGTGRSDFPNQINNVLVFPGIFKGALKVRAKEITEEMKAKAAYAIAGLVPDDQLSADYIIPDALDHTVADRVADAVAEVAIAQGLARIERME